MNIFKRAVISVWANKGKTLLLFVMFLVTMLTFTSKFMVEGMYNSLLKEAFPDGRVPVEVWPEPERTTFGGRMYSDESPTVTDEMYQEFTKLDSVAEADKDYYGTFFTTDYQFENSNITSAEVRFIDNIKETDDDGYTYDYDADLYKSLENPIIVNDKFLDKNELSVGDKLTFNLNINEYSDGETDIEDFYEKEYVIVGTYSFEPTQEMIDQEMEWAEEYGGEPDLDFSYYYNTFFMPKEAARQIENKLIEEGYEVEDSILWVSRTLFLKDAAEIKNFEKEVEKITGFGVDVSLNIYGQSQDEITDVQETVMQLSWTIMMINQFLTIIVVVVSILIMIIAIMLVRSRRKELGILIALGERRSKVYLQLVIEQLVVVLTTTIVSYPLVYILLKTYATNADIGDLPFVLLPILPTIGAGIVLVLFSTLIPAIYTLRLNPKKILL